MNSTKLTVIVVVVAISSALVGSGITYQFFPRTDPELKELLQKQLSIAEKEQADKAAAEKAMKDFFGN